MLDILCQRFKVGALNGAISGNHRSNDVPELIQQETRPLL